MKIHIKPSIVFFVLTIISIFYLNIYIGVRVLIVYFSIIDNWLIKYIATIFLPLALHTTVLILSETWQNKKLGISKKNRAVQFRYQIPMMVAFVLVYAVSFTYFEWINRASGIAYFSPYDANVFWIMVIASIFTTASWINFLQFYVEYRIALSDTKSIESI